jgi:DNA-binding transcriptional ArsR family regulator
MNTKTIQVNTKSIHIFNRAQRALLSLLWTSEHRDLHLRELVRRSGLTPLAIQRELARMVTAGLLIRRESGRQVYFRANPEHPIYPELHGLARKLFGIEPLLREALTPLGRKIEVAFIYGSFARGEETAESDVDVMVIGEASLRSIVSAVKLVAHQTGREINPTVYPVAEYRAKLHGKQHFLTALQKQPKLFLIGDADELARLGR